MKSLKKSFIVLSIAIVLLSSIVAASVESDFLNLVNAERARLGRGQLAMNSNLQKAAYDHSVDMATNNYFSHTSLDGRSFVTRIRNAGYSGYSSLGENIAYHSGPPNAQMVYNMWKGSIGHYQNMINPNFNEMGLGVYYYNGRTYYTQDLGRRSVVSPLPTPTPIPNPSPISDPIPEPIVNVTDTTPPNASIRIVETQSSKYSHFRLFITLDEKSLVYLDYDNKTTRICSSCTRFSQYFRIPVNSSQEVNYRFEDKYGNKISKSLLLS